MFKRPSPLSDGAFKYIIKQLVTHIFFQKDFENPTE